MQRIDSVKVSTSNVVCAKIEKWDMMKPSLENARSVTVAKHIEELHLTPKLIRDQLHANNVTHVVWLPDTETSFMYNEVVTDHTLNIVPVCREGESMAVAAGLWIGGKTPVVMIQNTGLFESGDSLRGLTLDIKFPLVVIVGYRGWTRHGTISDSAARYTEPILHAWNIKYYLIESDENVSYISKAFQEAEHTGSPTVCLIGAEYS